MTTRQFQKIVWEYYRKHGRHDLLWRHTHDPYRVLVSEVMLQQTQALRVVPKYKEFIKKFPTVQKLAKAENREVLALWSGLGYNRRALYLKCAAEIILKEHKGKFPKDFETIKTLPGIGNYTASAVLAFAYNRPSCFIETNIRSVFIHHFFPSRKKVPDSELLSYIEKTLPQKPFDRLRAGPRQWYWALMDYGAYLKKINPNPSRRSAHHALQSKFKGSVREVRGAILRYLLKKSKVRKQELIENVGYERVRSQSAIDGLTKDGLVQLKGDFYKLI